MKYIQKALPIAYTWEDEKEYIAGDSFTLAGNYYHYLFAWLKIMRVKFPVQT